MKPSRCQHTAPTEVDCPHANPAIVSLRESWKRSRDRREAGISAFIGFTSTARGRQALVETIGCLHNAETVSRALHSPSKLTENERQAFDDFLARLFTWLQEAERRAEEDAGADACDRAAMGGRLAESAAVAP